MEDGKFAYLVGKFITFETAAEYADLLKRNGYREAQVVAWLGKKEIPIETARHLFDNLK
jgi:sulfur carrier protein ThiS